MAERAGADSITVHLREDRRHIQDRRRASRLAGANDGRRMNLEMAVTDEMIGIAARELSPRRLLSRSGEAARN